MANCTKSSGRCKSPLSVGVPEETSPANTWPSSPMWRLVLGRFFSSPCVQLSQKRPLLKPYQTLTWTDLPLGHLTTCQGPVAPNLRHRYHPQRDGDSASCALLGQTSCWWHRYSLLRYIQTRLSPYAACRRREDGVSSSLPHRTLNRTSE